MIDKDGFESQTNISIHIWGDEMHLSNFYKARGFKRGYLICSKQISDHYISHCGCHEHSINWPPFKCTSLGKEFGNHLPSNS